jgi:hypothetical protein
MQHRRRDGRRRWRNARCDHLTMIAVDIEGNAREAPFSGRQLAGTHASNLTWLRATFSGTNLTGLSRKI